MKLLSGCAISALGESIPPLPHAEEREDSLIVQRILGTREAILKVMKTTDLAEHPIFIAAWDFDGTILKGDCSEGLQSGGRTVYRGLAQVTIESGLSELYSPDGGFARFWNDFTNMDARMGPGSRHPFVAQILQGARADDVLRLSQQYFSTTLSNYLLPSPANIIRALEHGGVECHILSASPDLFVKGAALTVGLPAAHLHGIQVRTRDGRLTEELIYPVTWSVGKLERLRHIMAEAEQPPGNRRAFVLAGFGDSYDGDGPFLKFIATQHLPAGEPTAVFYGEGAEPAEYKGLFLQARHIGTHPPL